MTPEELGEITAKQEEAERQYKHRLHVCTAAGCLSSGSDKVKAALEKEVKDRGLEHQCKVKGVGCMGLCANGPSGGG
jgi:bidirectional [NiFe] hydrogenase diaphorase subunit